MTRPDPAAWEERFAGEGYLFGTEPNAFLAREAGRIRESGRVLAVADGEGRNGVWLAEQGFAVHSVEGSPAAVAKAVRLAGERGVPVVGSLEQLVPGSLLAELGDVLAHPWPSGSYDAVAAIFIQFAAPDARAALFEAMAHAVVPDDALLRDSFAALDIEVLEEHDVEIAEGVAHRGMSAVIDVVARAR